MRLGVGGDEVVEVDEVGVLPQEGGGGPVVGGPWGKNGYNFKSFLMFKSFLKMGIFLVKQTGMFFNERERLMKSRAN